MIRDPPLLAALGALAGLVLGATIAAAGPADQRGRDAGRPQSGGFERYEPMRGIPGSDRREPGYGAYGYPPPAYGPGPYPSAPQRRPPIGAIPPGVTATEGPGFRGPPLAPLESIVESIQRRSSGHVLDAKYELVDGRQVYRIRWVTIHGRRMDTIVDAETGARLSER